MSRCVRCHRPKDEHQPGTAAADCPGYVRRAPLWMLALNAILGRVLGPGRHRR